MFEWFYRMIINRIGTKNRRSCTHIYPNYSLSAKGNVKVIVVPLPRSLSATILPPMLSTIIKQTERPSPVPLPGSLVVKKGSKMLPKLTASIPNPLSVTSILSHFSADSAVVSWGRLRWCSMTESSGDRCLFSSLSQWRRPHLTSGSEKPDAVGWNQRKPDRL